MRSTNGAGFALWPHKGLSSGAIYAVPVSLRPPVWPVALFLICSIACSDGVVPAESGRSGPRDSSAPLRGTERLAWDQVAPSYLQLREYGFFIYVDGAGSAMPGVECLDSLSAAGFLCSSALPPMSNGRHTIQVAAVVNGAESERSPAIAVTVDQGRLVGAQTSDRSAEGRLAHSAPRQICVTASTCFSIQREVTRPHPVSSPAALPDGRL